MIGQSFFGRKSLRDAVIESGAITAQDYDALLAKKPPDETVFRYLVENGPEGILPSMLAFAETEQVSLLDVTINQEVVKELEKYRDILFEHQAFGYDYKDDNKDVILIAAVDPTSIEMQDALELRIGKEIEAKFANPAEISQMYSQYYGDVQAIEDAASYLTSIEGVTARIQGTDEEDAAQSNSPVVNIVNTILVQAARMRASDVHIEPFENILRIRYRVDGALVERPSFDIRMAAAIVSRLKIMSGMNIAEKRIPQDGRITFFEGKLEYDVRASILPTVYGEKVVLRLNVKQNLSRSKKELGLTDFDLKRFDKVFANPNGIILVTGPTGSGKSTTLYTALSELNQEDVNIITVEDPVEMNIHGINQVQTNDVAGLTFATALRSILRQDPDIIMIGEIRDGETAEIATQAAITGHLVVSTLHTNSSAAAIPRLVNMGIEPYLVADSVVGILAQRLVRRLCPRCKKPHVATPAEREELGLKPDAREVTIYDKCGCPHCNNTGYKGRIAVYEILIVTPEIKRIISNKGTTEEIQNTAIAGGMKTLHRSAAECVIKGITSVSEMKKVAGSVI